MGGSIVLAMIAGIIPGKQGRPVISFVAHPSGILHSENKEHPEGCSPSVTETEPEAGEHADSPFPFRDGTFRASFVKPSDSEILCDLCASEILEGQCQICWIRENAHGKFHLCLHSHCLSARASQDNSVEEAMRLLCDQIDSETDTMMKATLEDILLGLVDVDQRSW